MEQSNVTRDHIISFEKQMRMDEKSDATIRKYLHDLLYFFDFANGKTVDKQLIMEYKARLRDNVALSSANSMLAALNSFLKFIGRIELCVKQFKIQKSSFCSEDKELTKAEYIKLVRAAEKKSRRLSLVMQTICATGIRISELEFITVEAAKRGKAIVTCKGKTRTVFIVSSLCRKLIRYANSQGIKEGKIFITRSGKSLDRSNIWQEMKSLCREAFVNPGKVFPHNLRHLFARTFYGMEKDIAKLADILGHGNINTTRIYIISTGAEHRRKLENMHLII